MMVTAVGRASRRATAPSGSDGASPSRNHARPFKSQTFGVQPVRAMVSTVIVILAILIDRVPGQDERPSHAQEGAARPPLARLVPKTDLVLYLQFDGLQAHADAWRASAAYKLLNETRLGSVIEDLVLQVVEMIQESEPREQRIASAAIVDILKQVARDGFVLGVTRNARQPPCR